MILVTGGAGFIGSNFVLDWLANSSAAGVVNLDKLTYASNLRTLADLDQSPRHVFIQGDINDYDLVLSTLRKHSIHAIVHLAAESHVDRSIDGPSHFVQTNVMGTFHLLEAVRAYWNELSPSNQDNFRFVHVSTDEVYGSLQSKDPGFTEMSPYKPSSPYSASKAASDHLVHAWHHTYGLPVLTTYCSNNFGPYQYPEKLIPLIIMKALAGQELPIYGDGQHIRDWLFVKDHCAAIREVLAHGRTGEAYNIGGGNEKTNLEIVHKICTILDELKPKAKGSYFDQINFVNDRPGHDRRYAVDSGKLQRELGWKPQADFEVAIRETVQWYVNHQDWMKTAQTTSYLNWLATQYSVKEV